MKRLEALKPVALLALRLVLALIFVYAGWPKLFGNTQSIAEFFGTIGLPAFLVPVAGVVELFGGALLAAGFYTRVAALLLSGQMVVAIFTAHMGRGVLVVSEYQFPLALAAAALVLATTGPGIISLDHAIFRDKA
ncbi:MAG TPA: DoxX family protein [Candidatus Acidoferrales bacterium]